MWPGIPMNFSVGATFWDTIYYYQFETAVEVKTGQPFSKGLIVMSMFVSNGATNQAREFDMR